ncbi:S41 family peptidase [Sphingomonas sp. BN140010]|uniref:S41 family peptidase n=1 Tax=Sphingomonas arvum TaxID=2992113 RepID=A0ABT3JG60_9SPHN|nr:S41 family peptidase [Sphingomonas sp. BN140010]MCW3798067.1 S41 family peptidase [Sphingomonas sp. BN140010]
MISLLVLTSATAPLNAQSAWHAPTAQPATEALLTPAQRTEVINALAERLETTFYSPDIARAYAAALRTKLQAKGYDAITSRDTLARTVTADLQAINKDGHLGLRAGAPGTAPNGQRRDQINAIARSDWLADGVAYLEFRIFNGEEAGLAQLKQFIADHSTAKTLIIDVRRHYGGGTDEMDVLFPALYAEPTTLLQGDMRAEVAERTPGALDSTPDFLRVAGPAGVVRHEHRVVPPAGGGAMSKAKVYLLISRDTVSAGEHMAMALKRTGRATLIGQTTRGAGNFGQPFKLPHGFSAFVPFGRTFDPVTGEGWEGTGVRPNVEVPAERALDEALKLAGVTYDSKSPQVTLR